MKSIFILVAVFLLEVSSNHHFDSIYAPYPPPPNYLSQPDADSSESTIQQINKKIQEKTSFKELGSEESEENIQNLYTDENIMKNIERLIKRIRRKFGEKLSLPVNIVIDSVDKNCIRDHFKENNMTSILVEGQGEKLDEAYELFRTHRLNSKEVFFSFHSTLALCSSKLDNFLEFVFDNLITYHTLYKAFINELELNNYTSYIYCINKFAVDSKIIEETIYDTKLKLGDNKDELCLETTLIIHATFSKMKIELRKDLERICSINNFDEIIRYLLKTFILIQVDLTWEQQKHERENFIKNTREILNNINECLSKGHKSNWKDNLLKNSIY